MKKYVMQYEYTTVGTLSVEAETSQEAAKQLKRIINSQEYPKFDPAKLPLEDTTHISQKPEQDLRIWSEEDIDFFDRDGYPYPELNYRINEDDNKYLGSSVYLWGIKAGDEMCPGNPGWMMMDDIDVWFDHKDNKYYAEIEEIYGFQKESDKVEYLENLNAKFREYVLSVGYTEEDLADYSECTALECYYPTDTVHNILPLSAYTLRDLWQKFNLFVAAYKGMQAAMGTIDNNTEQA